MYLICLFFLIEKDQINDYAELCEYLEGSMHVIIDLEKQIHFSSNKIKEKEKLIKLMMEREEESEKIIQNTFTELNECRSLMKM